MTGEDLQMPRQLDFYQEMRGRIRVWLEGDGSNYKFAKYILAAPDLFHLLCRLAVDKDVEASDKTALVGAIIYFVSPLDVIPEALTGPIGFVDDIAVAALVLNRLVNKISPEIITRHWAGEEDVLELVQQIIRFADEMVGSGLWAKIQKRFS